MPFSGLFVQKSAKNAISDSKNGHDFSRCKSFEVKCPEKMPLTPSNVPTKFCWNNQIDLEKSAQM